LRVQGYSSSTLENYSLAIGRFLEHLDVEGRTPFERRRGAQTSVDHGCLLRFLQKIRGLGVKETTLQGHKSAISSWYEWLIRCGHVDRNPIDMLAPIKTQEVNPDPLPVEDTLKILAEVRLMNWRNLERNRAVLELFYASGIRLNELRMLDASDMVLNDRRPHCVIRYGKGKQQGIGRLTPEAVDAVKAWLPKRSGILRKWEKPAEPALFVSRIGDRLGEWRIWNMVVEVGQKILGRRIHPHQFRHSFCTDLLNNGADLESIRKLARHKNLNTTQKYLAVSTAHLDEAYAKLPRRR